MKIMEGTIKEVILEDNDLLLVSTMKGNQSKVYIKAQNGELEIDNISVKKMKKIMEEIQENQNDNTD